jgi:O-antigen/teichoic acid export membrane protein
MKSKLFSKFLSFSYGSWIGLIIGFITTIITTRLLTPEQFGIASFFNIIMNLFVIVIIFGSDQSFSRFFYEESKINRGSLLYNCLRTPIFIAVFVIFTIIILNKPISLFLFEEYNFTAMLFFAIGVLVMVLYRFGTVVIRMQQKGNLYSLLEILNKGLSLLLVLVFFKLLGPTYEIIIYSTVITLFILLFLSVYFESEFWSFKNNNGSNKTNLKHTRRDIFNYGSPLVFTILITWLFQSFGTFSLKYWSNLEELGLYAAALKIVALLTILQTTFSTFWTPVCYEQFHNDPNNKELYRKVSNIISFIMFFIAICCIAGRDILVLILGPDYKEAAKIMPFLVMMPIMYTISETTGIGINFFKKTKWHIFIASISCLVNVIINTLLVPSFGALGAAISTGISYIVFFSLRTFISQKFYKVNFNLTKIYIMILAITLYSFVSILSNSLLLDIIIGILQMLLLVLLYHKDINQMYRRKLVN